MGRFGIAYLNEKVVTREERGQLIGTAWRSPSQKTFR